MGFFSEFNAWLTTLLATYISDKTALIATALTPTIITCSTVYVMIWGYLHLTGRIEEPISTGLKRIITLVVLLGASLHLWLYNDLIVDTVFTAPGDLAAKIIGAPTFVDVIDQIIFSGGDIAETLIKKGGIFDGNFAYYLAGLFVYAVVGLVAIYTIFLLTLSRIALSVLLALGPLLLAALFFESTKRFFESWIAQLANYAFITILTILIAALMLHLVTVSATQATALGDNITIASAVRVCMAAGLTFLVMRQVMPMASGLASGLSLSTLGALSSTLRLAFRHLSRTGGQFLQGAARGAEANRAPLARAAGVRLHTAAMGAVGAAASRIRNYVRRPKTRT